VKVTIDGKTVEAGKVSIELEGYDTVDRSARFYHFEQSDRPHFGKGAVPTDGGPPS
jgi:hypothetical protein